MAQLMGHSRSVLPLWSAKAREFGEFCGKNVRVLRQFKQIKLAKIDSFRTVRPDRWKVTLDLIYFVTCDTVHFRLAENVLMAEDYLACSGFEKLCHHALNVF